MVESGTRIRSGFIIRPAVKAANALLLVGGVFLNTVAYADKLKNSEFLTFSESQRHWWYSGAYTALGHIAFLQDKEKGVCVWNWLASDYERKEALLMKSFKTYPNHTPPSIVIALLRRDCGVFIEDNKTKP